MSSKTKSKSDSKMTYGYMNTPDTPDIIAARQAAQEDQGADPSIGYRYARQRQNLNQISPFGANYAPETREAMKYARGGELEQAEGAERQADFYNRKQRKFQNLYGMAGLTGPKLVQTGGSSTGSTSSFNPLGWAGMGLNAGMGALSMI
jgi:hypothetical protein